MAEMLPTPECQGEAPGADDIEAPTGFGDYDVLEEMARGGMGIVYRAHQRSLNRWVALKLVVHHQLSGETSATRFRHEAEAAASLDHPNIVPIYEVGEHDGRLFYTMKLIEGGTLADALADPGRFPLHDFKFLCRLLSAVADAVHHAHLHGILHRDLKPANILLDAQGNPHVADFGLAKRLLTEEGIKGTSVTRTGAVLGTPAYFSPEQARGERVLTPATDIYSLGAILYEILAGGPVFGSANMPALLRQIVEDEPVSPERRRNGSDATPRRMFSLRSFRADRGSIALRDLSTIALKCLRKEPDRRYPNAAELAADLRRVLREEPILARPLSLGQRGLRWARRKPAAAFAALLALATPAVLIVTLAVGNQRVRQAREITRRNLYAADMNVAQSALEDDNLSLARHLLESHLPSPGESDLRGFEWRYLSRRVETGELRVLRSHARPIRALRFSPDGRFLASMEAGPVIWFWDTTTWRKDRVIDWSGPSAHEFRSMSFSPDGAVLAVGTRQGSVVLFDSLTANSMKAAYMLNASPSTTDEEIQAIWSPQAPLLAFVGQDSTSSSYAGVLDWLRFSSTKPSFGPGGSGQLILSATPPFQAVDHPPALWLAKVDRLYSFTADGHLLVGRGSELLELNPARPGDGVPIPSAHRFSYCERSPDSRYLAGFNSDPVQRSSILLDEYVGLTTNYWEIIGHSDAIRCLVISPDGQRLLTGSADHTARVWDARTREPLAVFRGHSDEVTAVAWSPDGRWIATGSKDRTVRIWSSSSTSLMESSAEPLRLGSEHWVMSEDGRCFATAAQASSGSVPTGIAVGCLGAQGVTKLGTGTEAFPLWLSGFAARVGGIAVRGSDVAEVREWEVKGGRSTLVRRLERDPTHSEAVSASVWAVDSERRWLASGDPHGWVQLWPLSPPTAPGQDLAMAGGAVNALAFSPKQARLAVVQATPDGGGQVKVWRVDDPRTAPVTKDGLGGARSCAWSMDGSLLAVGSDDHRIRLFAFDRRSRELVLEGHKHGVIAIAFSPDDRTLATSDGSTLKLWQTSTGRELLTLFRDRQYSARVRWLAFAPDGQRLVAGDQEGGITLYLGPNGDGEPK